MAVRRDSVWVKIPSLIVFVFKKLDCILSRSLLGLRGLGEVKCGFKLLESISRWWMGVGSWFRPVVVIIVKLYQWRFWGSWLTNLAARPTDNNPCVLWRLPCPHQPSPTQGDNSSNTAGIIVAIIQELHPMALSSLSLLFTLFHELLDRLDVMLEVAMFGDE